MTLDPLWVSATVRDLVRTIYDHRTFQMMPVLGEALMDAVGESDEIIKHCQEPAPHVRSLFRGTPLRMRVNVSTNNLEGFFQLNKSCYVDTTTQLVGRQALISLHDSFHYVGMSETNPQQGLRVAASHTGG